MIIKNKHNKNKENEGDSRNNSAELAHRGCWGLLGSQETSVSAQGPRPQPASKPAQCVPRVLPAEKPLHRGSANLWCLLGGSQLAVEDMKRIRPDAGRKDASYMCFTSASSVKLGLYAYLATSSPRIKDRTWPDVTINFMCQLDWATRLGCWLFPAFGLQLEYWRFGAASLRTYRLKPHQWFSWFSDFDEANSSVLLGLQLAD